MSKYRIGWQDEDEELDEGVDDAEDPCDYHDEDADDALVRDNCGNARRKVRELECSIARRIQKKQRHKEWSGDLPDYTVSNDNRTLLNLLSATDAPASAGLMDYLAKEGDERLPHLRELIKARCKLPKKPEFSEPVELGQGTWWCIEWVSKNRVAGYGYKGTPLYQKPRAGRNSYIEVRMSSPKREDLLKAFDEIRIQLLWDLFECSPARIEIRRVILRDPRLDRVAKAFKKCFWTADDLIEELRTSDPARFAEILPVVIKGYGTDALPWVEGLRTTDPDRFCAILPQLIKEYGTTAIPWVQGLQASNPKRFRAIVFWIFTSIKTRKVKEALLDELVPGWDQRLASVLLGGSAP